MPTTAVNPESGEYSFGDQDDAPTINDVESLRQGIIKTSENKVRPPYNILLVGETGTGKSSFLEFVDNVLTGKDVNRYEFNTLDRSNEAGGSGGQSQTNSARIYELSSKNGILVRILDAPGLADTRGIERDAIHKKSIATEIQGRLGYVSAVLILANGSNSRHSVSTDYALSALSALFPKTLANNIAFLFSNVLASVFFNLPDDAIPEVLKHAPKFFIDNPIALKKNYMKQNNSDNIRTLVELAERNALDMMVDLFNWLDGLEPQPTKEIIAIHKKYEDIETKITRTLDQMREAATKTVEINTLLQKLRNGTANMNALSDFEKKISWPVWRQTHTATRNYLCYEPDCHTTCRKDDGIVASLLLLPFQRERCLRCRHPHRSHFHLRAEWVETQEALVAVDEEMKTKWEAAKNETEKIEALVARSERELGRLSDTMDKGLAELTQLAEGYAGLSLSGSFSRTQEKAIRLLEDHYKKMEQQGVSRDQLDKVQTSLENMKKRLDVLNNAKARAVLTKPREALSAVQVQGGGTAKKPKKRWGIPKIFT